jgi:segregation and condensation protein B
MEISTIIPHLEALVFASEKPLSTLELTDLVNNALGFIEDRASLDQVESALSAITEKYQSEFYPFEVKQSGGGWQFLTKPVFHKTVAQLNGEKFLKRLSTAALETLSIIAYKQPVTKGEIENIRGVNCDYAVQKLLEKELIVITGRRENSPGQPLIYATSKSFMDYFGINNTDDLPKLSDIMASESVEATAVGDSNPADEDIPVSDENTFVVTENGDIEEMKPPPDQPLENASDGLTEAELEEAAELMEQEAGDELASFETDEESVEAHTGTEEDEGLTEAELDEAIAEIEHEETAEGETSSEETKEETEEAEGDEAGDDEATGPGKEHKQKPDESAGGTQ